MSRSFADKHPEFLTEKPVNKKKIVADEINAFLRSSSISIELKSAIEMFSKKNTTEALGEINCLLTLILDKHKSEKE
jgi:hypothetical protein